MFNMTLFAERLKEIIFDNKSTAVETAKAINVPKSTVYRYINEERLPRLDILIKLADYFKCSISYLIGIDSENYEQNISSCPPFSDRFNFILKKSEITKYKLKKDIGISESIIYSWLKGQSIPNLESIIKLAQYFDCSVDYLIGRSENQ